MAIERTGGERHGSDPGAHVSAWNPDLSQAVCEFLCKVDLGGSSLDGEIRELEGRYGDAAYSELLHLLSHLRFDPEEAKEYWHRILDHRAEMAAQLNGFVDLRVALVNYFLQVNRRLENPKIIELKLYEQTRDAAYRDELTGLHNFRFFNDLLNHEVGRCERDSSPLSLLMIDVDDFKQYNDRHGHDRGNEALALVGSVLRESMRRMDAAVRYGGEEFAVILPSTPKAGAYQVAERIRDGVDRRTEGRLTVSIGLATCPADARSPGDLVHRADGALYAAKDAGKNQVQLYGHSYRSFRRVDLELTGTFTVQAPEPMELRTLDLSEGGLLFRTPSPVPVNSLIEVSLALTGGTDAITMAARVISVEADLDEHEVAVAFVDLTNRDRSVLTNYLRELSIECEEAVVALHDKEDCAL